MYLLVDVDIDDDDDDGGSCGGGVIMGQATIITLNEIIITLLRIEDTFINTIKRI